MELATAESGRDCVGAMSNLAVNSPEGRKYLEQEQRAYEIFWRNNPDHEVVETDKSLPAKADALLVKGGIIQSVVLTACRNFTIERLCSASYDKRWLLTTQKLVDGALLADMLCASLQGFLYLEPEDCLLVKELRKDRFWVADIAREDNLPTQANCTTDKKVIRPNSMIDMRGVQ